MSSVEVPRNHRFADNGAAIRRARKQLAGMSQERFADVIGTTRRHMIRLENGEHLPSVALRDRIAEATGEKRDKFQAADDDEESSAVPLSTGEFAMLGDLMARLGASLSRAATA